MTTRTTRSTRTVGLRRNAKDWERLMDLIRSNDTESVREWFRQRQIPDSGTLGSQFPQYLLDPVYEAAVTGNLDIFDLLVQHGFKLDRITKRNINRSLKPVHIAASRGHLKIVRKLISECHIPVDSWDNWNRTPLMYAVSGAHTAVVKYLLSEGADINYCPFEELIDSIPLVTALRKNNTELAHLLLEHGADINRVIPPEGCLVNAYVDCGELPMVEWLLRNGARTDIIGCGGYSVFHYAMKSPHNIKMIKFLIGINVPLNQLTHGGHTALDEVIHEYYHPELSGCLKLIVDAGFHVTWNDYDKACQIWTTDTDLLLVKQLQSCLSHPRSLQQLCCFSIREILGAGLPNLVQDLPVPSMIKEYIRLDHLVNP